VTQPPRTSPGRQLGCGIAALDVRTGRSARWTATPSFVGTLSRFRTAGCGSDELKSRGVEDRAGVIDGANVRLGGQALADLRANQRAQEGRQCPLTTARGWDRGYRRQGKSGISRAQGARAGLRLLAWHFLRRCGNGSRSAKKLEMSHFTDPWRLRVHVASSASSPSCRRRGNAARQDRQKQSDP
jgi:hypothetical protein